MNIRQLLNIPSKKQKLILNTDIKTILDRCDKIAKQESNEQLEAKQFHDSICPNCKERTNIVNKIGYVQSTNKFTSNVKFGFGSISHTVELNACEVNHCNNCGNEWLKFKTKNITKNEIIRVVFNYLAQIIENSYEKNCLWKMEAIQVFDDCCAEAIFKLKKDNDDYLYDSTNLKITMKCLRKYYKSIYDTKNKKILKKI